MGSPTGYSHSATPLCLYPRRIQREKAVGAGINRGQFDHRLNLFCYGGLAHLARTSEDMKHRCRLGESLQ